MDGININSAQFDWALMVASGKKSIETRRTNSLKSHIGQRVYIVRTGRGAAQIIGEVTIGEPIVYHTRHEFDSDYDSHLVDKYSEWYINDGAVKYGYPMLDPVLYGRYYTPCTRGIVVRKNLVLSD